ncbi:zinc finger protein ZFAT-like isoform X2 [Erpetoichthys calabaricus]|uniref:zinc finger protein ZFAT-like isoform X2 n=1 Tax=Erpetoichthys calabaricus TaxID=27687 RepID=UPI002234557F|nr:zinc finger protein ZFAT-like isoform X2 [Erpetoichthys calabaricus]
MDLFFLIEKSLLKNPGGISIFMCKICNLFSPNQSELLAHFSEKHVTESLNPNDIIVPLRPLSSTLQLEKGTEECHVIKRKRGRPKGSTKKFYVEEELVNKNTKHTEEVQPEEQEVASEDPGILECRKCCRKFCNKRQLKKHICIMELEEDGDDEEEKYNDSTVRLTCGDKDEDIERPPKKARIQRSEKVCLSKDPDQSSGAKQPIISVVLTAHEAIPGATKIVPIEATPAEIAPAVEPNTSAQDTGAKRGYQEYSIQQASFEKPMKSNRLGQTQLKIFTCEYCNKVFKFKHSLQAHLRIHTNEKPFKCPHCDYASAIKANLSVHLRKHTGEKFSCEYCSFSCLSKGHLKVHVERVHKKIKQHCRFCKKKYSDVKNLLKHVRESHDMVDKKVKDNYDELCLQTREGKRQLLYDCHICDRKFKNELDRDRHMMVHGDERPYACELCDHGVTKFQALEAHIRKHPFIYLCGVCLNKFVSSVRLRSHIKDVHPDLEESIIFGESINQSFCLLEPGGDIQPDSLKEQELQITEEMTLLKTQNALVEELVATDDFSGKENVHSLTETCQDDHVLVQEAVCTEVREITEQHTHDLPGDKVQDNRVMNTDNGHVVSEECTDAFNPESMVDSTDNQPSSKENNSPIVEHSRPDKPVVDVLPLESMDKLPVQNHLTLSINYHSTGEEVLSKKEPENSGNYEVISETVQMTGKNILSDPDEQVNNKLESDSPVQYAAFKKILDGMQKRQLNRDLFERIRKVYGDLECEYCGKLFWYQVHYDMHIRTHTREHLYYCSQCSYSSITKNCLKRHVIQKHSNILLKCPTEGCEYTTPDKYKLQAHLKIHTELDKRNYNCPVCMKSFPEDRLIKSHIKTNHPEVSMNTISQILGRRVQLKGLIGKRASKCPYCDCYFMRNGSDLQRHIWAHEGLKPFKCSVCDYATRSKSNLKAHMNRHNTEKTHLCDMCGKKFKSKSTLKSHKLLHTADGRQFKCTVCEYTAAQKPQLLRHMEQHAYFKPFRCAHCHYSCNISGSLKRHYNRKHPNEQYANAGMGPPAVDVLIQQGGVKCPVCNYVYGTKWEMNRHLKNKHGLKLLEVKGDTKWEVVESTVEESSTQYLHTAESEDLKGTEAAVAALQDLRYNTENGDRLDPTAVNILQQIIEMGAENHDAAVASVVAMAPGTVTVVEQVAEEQQQTDHAVMIQEALQQASVELGEEHHLVVSSDDMEGIETVTVYTQGEDASEFIVYVQEAVQAEEEQTVETL